MGTVQVGMARLWLGYWPLPLPADEDMALGAGSLLCPAGVQAGSGGPRELRLLRELKGALHSLLLHFLSLPRPAPLPSPPSRLLSRRQSRGIL